jgi:hypothetical protein
MMPTALVEVKPYSVVMALRGPSLGSLLPLDCKAKVGLAQERSETGELGTKRWAEEIDFGHGESI